MQLSNVIKYDIYVTAQFVEDLSSTYYVFADWKGNVLYESLQK